MRKIDAMHHYYGYGCGFCFNDTKNHIPLWKYKLIRFKREVLNL